MHKERFNKEIVRENLKRLIGADIFERGLAYYNDNLVGRITAVPSRAENIKITAFVLGSDEYETNVVFNLKKASFENFDCSCPVEWDDCKHGAALGLKFIDLYGDFCRSGISDGEDGTLRYKKELAQWIKGAKENKVQDWEDNVYDERDSDGEYADGSSTFGRSASEMKKNEPEVGKNSNISDSAMDVSLKQRLKSIGIDVEHIPESVIAQLEKKFGNNDIKIGLELKPTKIMKKEELGERLLRKYCLILNVDYFPKIELHEKNKPDASYWALKPEELLNREKGNLTPKQIELLVYLVKIQSQYFDTVIDWGMLFGLVKDSELAIFINKKLPKYRLLFKENPQKLASQLFVRDNHDYPSKDMEERRVIVFKFKGDLLEKENIKIFASVDALVVLDDFQLEIFPMPKILLSIISRILENARSYHYGYQPDRYGQAYELETRLNGEEIILINNIIQEAEKAFQFENKLSAQYEINKFKKIGPTILVDYDCAKSSLQLKVAMDYGFAKKDISNTVYKSTRGGQVSFQRRFFTGGQKYYFEIIENKINYAEIKSNAEIALYKQFSEDEKCGFSKTVRCSIKGAKQIAIFHEKYWNNIKALGFPIEYSADEFDFAEENFKADFKVDFNEANDWFEFDVNCYCGENKITLEDLRKYVENKDEFIRMADGRLAKITNRAELEKFVRMLESFYQKEGQKFEAKIYHAPELEDIISGSEYYESTLSKSFKKFMDEAQSGKPVEKVKIPEKIKKPLRDYQKEGIDWFYFLRKYHFGGILADDMGLGKTLQALSLVEMNKLKDKPSIVICPKTLLFNWEDEAMKFFPKMKTLVIDGFPEQRQQKLLEATKYDLVITSYPSVKKDEQYYEKIKFNYCFIDEAQYIKNHKTLSARSVKKINADFRLALTGTPLENSVSEIWSLFDFLMPGFLGTHRNFGERFEKPIMKHADGAALEALKKKISCFMLRRTKEKVLKELPPKIEQESHCQLGAEQNILYQEILANVKSNIFGIVEKKGFAKSQIHILAGLTKLRQVCNHPVLLLKDKEYTKYESAKLELFLELVGEIVASGRKVLVFSQFTQMLDILAKELAKGGIKYHYLSGKTKNRKELVNDFNSNEKIPVFLISLKAGGTGLNLVSADSVIIFDPWWNPSVENQAIDRAHRIGQKKSVNVHRLIVKGTIEERIVKLQEKKKFLFDNMVGESNDLFQKLTWSEVKELFD